MPMCDESSPSETEQHNDTGFLVRCPVPVAILNTKGCFKKMMRPKSSSFFSFFRNGVLLEKWNPTELLGVLVTNAIFPLDSTSTGASTSPSFGKVHLL